MMNTLHLLTQQDSIGLWRELVIKNSENSLEQIAVEGVAQNTLKEIGGSWSRKYTIQETEPCALERDFFPAILQFVTCPWHVQNTKYVT